MKIIHLAYSDCIGGASIAALRIQNCLYKNNINSRLWVNEKLSKYSTVEEPFNKIRKNLKRLRRYITWPLLNVIKMNVPIHHSISLLPSNWTNLINSSDVDIVNLHWIQRETMSIKDISKIKKPIVWTIHDMWAFCGAEHYTNDNRWREGYYPNNRPNYESGFDLNRWTWNRKKKYWKTPIQIISPSVWLAKCVSESALMKNWPVKVIYNPIDTDLWIPIDKKNARQLLNLSPDSNLILFGAATEVSDPRKGYDLLLSALEHVKADKKIKKIELVVFGQTKPKSQLNLGFPIHYFSQLENDLVLRTLYSAADLMVVPSRQDNLPNTAVEAQACGTPVVSFDIGGLPDIIEHQKTGYLAQAFDTRDLAKGITWVLEQSYSNKLGNNARERAIEKFSEKKISEDYVNVYKKLFKEK